MGLFNYIVSAWVTGAKRLDITSMAVITMTRMAEDIRSAAPILAEQPKIRFDGRSNSANLQNAAANNDELVFHNYAFSSSEASGEGGSGLVRTAYWLSEISGDLGLSRDKKNSKNGDTVPPVFFNGGTPFGTGSPAGAQSATTYGENVAAERILTWYARRLNFEYFNGTTWENDWNSATKGSLPELIRMTMQFELSGLSDTFQLIIRPNARAAKMNP